jgi:hypothetical protein
MSHLKAVKKKLVALLLCLSATGWTEESVTELPDLQAPPILSDLSEPVPEALAAFGPVAEVGLFRALMEFPVYSFYLGAPDVYGVAYVPNFSPRAGMQLQWKSFGLTLSAALPIPKEELDRRGHSQNLNFLLSRYWRQHGLDVYLQNYRGFYVASPWAEFSLSKPERYPQLPDAEITNYGFNYYLVLDPERYSLMAAFSQMELQMISGGSVLWTAFYNHLEMNRGGRFVLGTEPDSLREAPTLKTGIFDTLGLGGGYGYTWVFSPAFLTVQGLAGAGVQHQRIDETEDDLGSLTTGALKLNANAAIGFTYQSYSIGGKVLVDTILSDIRGTQVYSTLLNGLLFLGGRF